MSRFLSTLGAVATAWCLAAPAAAQLATEALTVAKLPAPDEHRLYVSDITIQHIVDNRLHVLDGASGRYLGQFATGYAGQSALSRDRKELYVTTSYYARLARGERSDVVEIHDPTTLDLVAEIAIPPRRAQALPYEGLVRSSVDGRWLFVQNVTPATSITVAALGAARVNRAPWSLSQRARSSASGVASGWVSTVRTRPGGAGSRRSSTSRCSSVTSRPATPAGRSLVSRASYHWPSR